MTTRAEPSRAPYETPRLEVYGDLAMLTQAVAKNSMNADGGVSKKQSKTA